MPEVGYTVTVDPEFPAGGGEPPERIPADLTRIGAVLRLTASGAEPWDIAIGAPNWWRTPIPTAVAFISDTTGYMVDVAERRVLVDVPGAIRVRQDAHHDLILLITQSELTAVGPDGVAWRSGRLADADLKVVSIDENAIHCSGYVGGELPSEIVVDPATGKASRTDRRGVRLL